MINNVTLVGRLTKDPELRYSNSGVAVCTFTLACDRYNADTDFIRCTVFQKQAESCAQYLEKGKLAGVVGSIKTGQYKNKEGQTVFTTEVTAQQVKFLSPKSEKSKTETPEGFVPYVPMDEQGVDEGELPF